MTDDEDAPADVTINDALDANVTFVAFLDGGVSLPGAVVINSATTPAKTAI